MILPIKLHTGDSLVLATTNMGKIREFSQLLSPYALDILTLKDLTLSAPDEIGVSCAENALIKAKSCAEQSNLPSLADDSGLFIRSLGGQPGVGTARWIGATHNYAAAFEKIHAEMRTSPTYPDRRATFICCLALSLPNGQHQLFQGEMTGEIVYPPRGKNNMGFDPIFKPTGYSQTVAEMSLAEKQKISHRFEAFQKFKQAVLDHVAH